jgi:hypothetical protein
LNCALVHPNSSFPRGRVMLLVKKSGTRTVFSSRVSSSCNQMLSVSTARFVTNVAVDLKLCTYVPLGEISVQTKFRSDLILENTRSATTPELMTGTALLAGHVL